MAKPVTPAPPPLWNRNFRLFFVARAVAVFGEGTVPVAFAAGLLGAGRPGATVGYALGAWTASFALLVLFGGVLADRFTARRMMILADLLRLPGMGILAVSFALGSPPLWAVYTLSALSGVGAALFQPGVASTIPRIAPDVQRANAVLRVVEALMTMAGPAAAGVLVAVWNAGAAFGVICVTFAVSALCLGLMRLVPIPSDSLRRDSLRVELVLGWREFTSRSWLWGVICIWTVYGLTVAGPMVPLTASLVTADHGAATYGVLMAVNGAGSALGGLLAIRVRPRTPLAAGAVALLGLPVNLMLLGMGAPVPLLVAGQFIGGTAFAFWLVMWSTSVQTHVPQEALNRMHAYDVAGSLLMMGVGRALSGPVAAAVGTETVLLTGAGIAVLVVCALLSVRPIRTLGRA
ncbi:MULTISPECIES: MFS transporter [unclassified Streptomyces]|uniref:MFS transporter n=1 Tax=unclassified Streptomyces TaxID=2593676 RepID=UPI0016601BE3|nr:MULTISPECIES: MFS transporter [unclassified Streptomyces]MBD0707208.1 MFS transporter [Streptomyces sp. CBMA291]MBD0713696.1 MFS transporter [Streptomyces sp. CBMA370]